MVRGDGSKELSTLYAGDFREFHCRTTRFDGYTQIFRFLSRFKAGDHQVRIKRRNVLISAAVLFVLWELLALALSQAILPPAHKVLIAFFREIPGELGLHFLASLWRVLASMFLAILIAAPAGLVLGI